MKKLVLSLALVASLSVAFADKVRIGTLNVANRQAMTEAAQRLAALCGNPMLIAILTEPLSKTSETAVEYAIVAENDDFGLEKVGEAKVSFATGELVKVNVDAQGVSALVGMAEKASGAAVNAVELATLKSVSDLNGSLRLTDRGLDLRALIGAVAGSELAKMGKKTLAADALAFAGKDAISVGANAGDVGAGDPAATVDAVLSVLQKNGVKLDFLQLDRQPNQLKVVMDVVALQQYIEGEGSKAFSKIEPEKFMAELRAAIPERPYKAESPAYASCMSVKGFAPKHSVAQRYAKTLPEAAGKPVYSASVLSLYSVVKATVPQLLAKMPEAVVAQVKPLVAALPEEGEGAIAGMYWREGEKHACLLRMSADEIRGIGAVANAVMGAMMAQAMAAPAVTDDDDED